MPELPEWRAFCAAARLLSITKAAEELGISAPTATKHIAKLESRMGVQLLDRTRRPLALTTAGARYALLAAPLVTSFDDIERHATDGDAGTPVTVAGPSGFISYKLPHVVRKYRDTFPHSQVRVHSRTKAQAVRLLIDGDADVALVDPKVPAELDYEPVYSFRRVVITPTDHPLALQETATIDEIAQYPMVLLRSGTTTRTVLEAELKRQEIPYEISLELDNIGSIKRYVLAGMGVSLVPEFIVEPEDVGRLGVVGLQGTVSREELGAATMRERPLSSAAGNFLALLRSAMWQ